MDVGVLGSLNIDVVLRCNVPPHPGETVLSTSVSTGPGGKGLNQAVAARRAGADTALIGAVGADSNGELLLAFLRSENVHIEPVTSVRGTPTGSAYIAVDRHGENSIMAITMARIIIPSTIVRSSELIALESSYKSSLDAITHGTLNAVRIAANVIALLIVFVGSISLLNVILAQIPHQGDAITLTSIFGTLLSPVAWLMGVPMQDLQTVGGLLATKVTLNEVVAYAQLADLPAGTLTERGMLIATYALCSFGSVAILIGILTAMAPEKGPEIVELGAKALLAAFLTTCMTGTIVGLLSFIF